MFVDIIKRSMASLAQTDVARRLQIFFYAQETPYGLALLRMFLPWVLLVGVWPRWFHARELFSSGGSPAPLWESYGHVDVLPILPPWLVVALYTILVFCLVTTSVGWQTRWSLCVVLVLYPYFGVLDLLSTVTKYVMVGTHLLLLLAVSNCGEVWSLDAWMRKDAKPKRFAVWPRRLVQLLLGVIYFSAAITKFQTPEYFTGEQLTLWMLTNENFPNPLGEYLTLFPVAVIMMGYATVLWEVVFPFVCWKGYAKWVVLSIGVVFHVMTILVLGLLIFPLMFSVCYFAFLEEDEARRLGDGMAKRVRCLLPNFEMTATQRSWGASVSSFASVLLLVSALGVTAEAKMDVFGERRAAGRFQLRELTDEEAQRMLRNDLELHPQDTVLRMDVGTTLMSGVIAQDRDEFRETETAIVQCLFIRPHEDLWAEVQLQDVEQHIVQRQGHIIARDDIRSNFHFPMHGVAPGAYQLVVKVDGQAAHVREIRRLAD